MILQPFHPSIDPPVLGFNAFAKWSYDLLPEARPRNGSETLVDGSDILKLLHLPYTKIIKKISQQFHKEHNNFQRGFVW